MTHTPLSIHDAGPPVPCPDSFNMTAYVLQAGQDDAVALEVVAAPEAEPVCWRYADLRDAVHRTAGGLMARGIGPGDRVLLRIGNDPAFPVLFLAAILIDAVPVPTSPLLTRPEVEAIAAELDPALTCFAGGLTPHPLPGVTLDADEVAALRTCDPVPARLGDPDRLAYMIYTSGTSGRPRAVMHAHRAVWARRMMWDGWYGLRADDRMLHAGAFNWTYTLGTGLMDPWAIGATAMVFTGPADRTIWGRIAAARRPTIFAAAPGVLRQIADAGATGFDSLRHVLCAGEALPGAVRTAWMEQTGKPIHEALGMSEVSTFISGAPGVPHRPGTAGRVQPGRRVAVIGPDGPVPLGTPGTLAVHRSDPGLMLGYMGQPTETAQKYQGGWFLTGDTVAMDAAGYVTYLGRDDDMMNAGGYRVSPVEVETALLAHPDVTDAAAAVVEVRPGVTVIAAFVTGTAAPDALITFCATRLAKYKCPRMVVPMDHLPRGANNKLNRRALRDWRPQT